MSISLLEDTKLPAFTYLDLRALFDTGAELSVFNASARMFELMFPNNYKNIVPWEIAGFGGRVKGKKYTVLSTEICGIPMRNVDFFIPDIPATRYKFVIAGTLFADYVYSIDMKKHILTIK